MRIPGSRVVRQLGRLLLSRRPAGTATAPGRMAFPVADVRRVQAHDRGGRVVVRFGGEKVFLDETTAQAVREDLLAVAGRLGPRELLVDLGNVAYLGSTALGMFLTLHRAVQGRGGRLALCNSAPQVYELFEVTRLHTLLDVRRGGPGTRPGG